MQKTKEKLKVCGDLPRRVLARVVAVQGGGGAAVDPFYVVTGGGGNPRDLSSDTSSDYM